MAPGTPRDTASGALSLPSDIGTQEAAQTGWTPNRTSKWKPEKYFNRVMLPKLVREDSLDIMAHLVEWAPARLNAIEKAIEEAMLNPTIADIKQEAKSAMTSHEGGTITAKAEHREKEGLRIMMKFRAPNQKEKVAGSHRFSAVCPHAYLYLDMLHLLMMVASHEKATFDSIKALCGEAKTYMEFNFQEE